MASGAKRRGFAIPRRLPPGRSFVVLNDVDCTGSPVRSGGVTGIDWLIVGVVVLLGLFGWAQGFVAGALALVGFAVGAYLGTRLGPLLLEDGRRSPWSPAFGLVGALIAGMVFAIGREGIGRDCAGGCDRPRPRRWTAWRAPC